MRSVLVDRDRLSLEDVVAVASGAPISLGPAARKRIRAAHAVVADAVTAGRPVYGLNTGVGHRKDVALPEEDLARQQEFLVRTHAGGIGPPMPTELVRAALAVRLVGIAHGGSGVSERAADVLVAMLNGGVHPVVAAKGSVGAGDLSQMATIALVVIGAGQAEFGGATMGGAEALARAGIEPLALAPKDGLGLLSANGVSIGDAALTLADAVRAVAAADSVVALSLEATAGNTSIAAAAVGRAKPFPGLLETCQNLSHLLRGSYLLDGDPARSVQDALSFRVAPQVHGTLREYVTAARTAVETELNSASDNPLVSVEDRALVHNGNFQPIMLGVAFDALRIAVAHAGLLSERRLSHLWAAFFDQMPGAGGPSSPSGGRRYGMSLRYPAGALAAELRQLAAPATLDVAPLDLGVEDHGTSAPLTVARTREALTLLADVLAVELLLARDVLATRPDEPRLGNGTRPLLTLAQDVVSSTGDRSAAAVHRRLRARFPRPLPDLEDQAPTSSQGFS